MAYILAYDVGTTGVKTCLFRVEKSIELVSSAQKGYGLYILENGGAEQDADEWWEAMCATTRELIAKSDLRPEAIEGVSFCSQMQGLVMVDKDGEALRRPMSYMDQRARAELKAGMAYGLQVAGANVGKLIKSLRLTGAVSSSVKDPVWKYKWVEAHEPDIFKNVYKCFDVKEYLICRCTGEFIITEDSAYSTFLYDTRKGKCAWSPELCNMLGVKEQHLPRIIKSTDMAGRLSARAAEELGLAKGTPVFGGGGDATLIGIGAGCTEVGQTHIYSGTSGWVSTIVDKQLVDTSAMIAAIVGAQSGKYNYFAEMETAGKCFEWVKDHLALDEIGIYLQKKHIAECQESLYISLYDYLSDTVEKCAPGSGGVIFTPWLHGNRCPFEDPNAAGMFFNIKLETGKTELIRSVLEGICYHLRWMLECQDKKIKTSDPVRFVGGGALSPVSCRMLADVTGRNIETVASPQNVGSVGAAAVSAIGLSLINDFSDLRSMIPIEASYAPNAANREVYDKGFAVFKRLYQSNKNNYKILNAQ